MPRASHAILEHQVEHGVVPPRVAPHLDQAEDPDQLIAILEDRRVRFYRFKAGTQELNEIQVDPKIDSHDRALDSIAPASVDELRGRTRDAVQMVLLINSAGMTEGTVQIVLDCMEEIKGFSGRVIAYGGGNIREFASKAWLRADERYSLADTNVMAHHERRATRIFDDFDSIRAHFSETTGWRTADNQSDPIEDFWEGVFQALEEEQRGKTWTQIMGEFHSWMERSNLELLYDLTDWKRGTKQNPKPEALFLRRVKEVSHTLAVHLFEAMADIDRDLYDELRALILKQKKPKEAIERLMQRTLDLLASGKESSIFNEALLSKLHALIDHDSSSAAEFAIGTSDSMVPDMVTVVIAQRTERASGTQKTASRRKQASSRLRHMGRWAVAAAFLAAPLATFHGVFGLNKKGVQEFASVAIDSARHHEHKNPFPFLESSLSAESSDPSTVVPVSEKSSAVVKWEMPCEIGDGLNRTGTSSNPVYIFGADGTLMQYPPCKK